MTPAPPPAQPSPESLRSQVWAYLAGAAVTLAFIALDAAWFGWSGPLSALRVAWAAILIAFPLMLT